MGSGIFICIWFHIHLLPPQILEVAFVFISVLVFVFDCLYLYFVFVSNLFHIQLLPPQMLEASSTATPPEALSWFLYFLLLLTFIQECHSIENCKIVKIYSWERPLQREGFPWHTPAPGKPRSDLGLQGPVITPSLTKSANYHLRKGKWNWSQLTANCALRK